MKVLTLLLFAFHSFCLYGQIQRPLNESRDSVYKYVGSKNINKSLRYYLLKEGKTEEEEYPTYISFMAEDQYTGYTYILAYYFDNKGICKVSKNITDKIEVDAEMEKWLVKNFCENKIISKYVAGQECNCSDKKTKESVKIVFNATDYSVIYTVP